MKRYVPCPRTITCTLPFLLLWSGLCLPAVAQEVAQTDPGPAGQTDLAVQQDLAALWTQLHSMFSTSGRALPVENTTLQRDAATITFLSGHIALAEPVSAEAGGEGRVFAAAFKGRGRLRFEPRLPMERQQLGLHTGQRTLEAEFTEAVLIFTDATFEELTAQLSFAPGTDSGLAALYRDRSKHRTKYGLTWTPRLLKSLLSPQPDRYAFFVAEMKTRKHGRVTLIVDSADPEEVELAQFDAGRHMRDIWAKFPAGGKRPQDVFADPLAHHDFRIQSYQLDITVEKSTELLGQADVALDMRRGGERVLLFQLDPSLRVTEVTDEAGHSLAFFQPKNPKDDFFLGDSLTVVASEPFEEGPLRLRFTYAGKRVVRKMGNGNFFCQSFGWYPTNGSGRYSITTNETAGKYDFDITLRVPKKYDAVVVGTKVEQRKEGEYNITRWNSDIPLKVAGFAYGDYKIVTEKSGETEIQIYANRQPDDTMRSIEILAQGGDPRQMSRSGRGVRSTGLTLGSLSPARRAKTMATEIGNSLRIMENFFGPYPYKKLAVANISGGFGQGWPSLLYLSSLSFMDSTQRHQFGIADQIQLTDSFRAHETSHQWWGQAVGWKSYHDQWLSEGFAEFSGNLYTLYRRDPDEYFRLFRNNRDHLLEKNERGLVYDDTGPIYAGRRLRSTRQPLGYNRIVYEKGGWVLHMLRMMLYDPRHPQDPDALFKAMMKDFTKTYFNRAASTEDFKKIVEKHMIPPMDVDRNGTMDWFFDSWVYGTGIPHYKFTYTITPAADGKFLLKGLLRQERVREGFTMIVPLYFHKDKGKLRVGWLTARSKETPIETLLPFKPDKVTINEMEDVLATID